ncbi:hypothetical protein ccbrp13_47010 [Ktedonobacteria bacterium brp13]|nr:hypothetical protein ccbrp13_47010 [Ktedonobacteria bacterium brp13]
MKGYGYWFELGIIFGGALLFRILLLPLLPSLSGDVWRYLWDGRVIAHGYNPYLYAPADKTLLLLRDSVFAHADWHQLPSIYPPVAEFFFVLGYLIMPTNVLGIKALFVICDLGTCAALAFLLAHKKMDPRRMIIYAWCPLPIVEFALQGHVDAVAIFFTIVSVLCASKSWRGARIWTGIFLGLATLAKIYPIILLLVIVRPRDWSLLISCGLTIILGYLPFMLFSNGHPLAVPLSFTTQALLNPGILSVLIFALESTFTHTSSVNSYVTDAVDILVLLPTFLIVMIQYWHRRMRIEMALLILIGSFMATSAYVFPWYVTALIPWLTLLITPIRKAQKFQPGGLALAMVWYFTFIVVLSYFLGQPQYNNTVNWLLYRGIAFGTVLLGWSIAAYLRRSQRKVQAPLS